MVRVRPSTPAIPFVLSPSTPPFVLSPSTPPFRPFVLSVTLWSRRMNGYAQDRLLRMESKHERANFVRVHGMKARPLGKSGISVSAVGLGCNALGGRIDLETSRRVIYEALDLGITLFDTADSTAEGQARNAPALAEPHSRSRVPEGANVEAGACTLTLQDLNEIDTLVSGSGAPTGLQVSTRAAPAVTH